MPCSCHEDQRVLICPRCEGKLTGVLTQAFNKGGYKVDLEYCEQHKSSN